VVRVAWIAVWTPYTAAVIDAAAPPTVSLDGTDAGVDAEQAATPSTITVRTTKVVNNLLIGVLSFFW